MQQVLLLYATREGQTEKVAARVADQLRHDGANVTLVNAHDTTAIDTLALSSFDLLVFGGSMHAGKVEKELVEFINTHRDTIDASRRSFFLVLLSAATKDPELRERSLADARSKLDSQLDVTFHDVEMVAGALRYSKYSLPLRWLMKRLARKAGEETETSRDYEYTDWNQVEAYARRLVAAH